MKRTEDIQMMNAILGLMYGNDREADSSGYVHQYPRMPSILTGVDGEDLTHLSKQKIHIYIAEQELRRGKGFLSVKQRHYLAILKEQLNVKREEKE